MSLGKMKLMMVGIIFTLCVTACGDAEKAAPSGEETFQEETSGLTQEETADLTQEESVDQTPAEEGKAVEEETELNGGMTVEEIRAQAAGNGDLCAAVFLGCGTDIASFLAETDLAEYPFLSEIPEGNYVEMQDGGTEIYCIIPTDPLSSLSVNEWMMDEDSGFEGKTGQVLYRSESGEPILLRANPSDILPDTQVIIVDNDGRTLDWNPSLSLRDGTMNIPEHSPGVTDITDYHSELFSR